MFSDEPERATIVVCEDDEATLDLLCDHLTADRFEVLPAPSAADALAIEGRSPYPEQAAFIDASTPTAGIEIERAADEGLAVVLVSEDGATRILRPEPA